MARSLLISAIISGLLTACSITTSIAHAQNPSSPSNLGVYVGVGVTRYDQAKAVLQKHCMGCHSGGSWNWSSFTTERAWVDAGLIVAGNMATSKITLRLKYGRKDSALSAEDMPSPKNSPLWDAFTDTDYSIIRDWILNINLSTLPTPTPGGGGGTPVSGTVYRASTDSIRLGDRFFVDSVLKDIFGPSVNSLTDTLIFRRVGFFGGPCDSKEFFTYDNPASTSTPKISMNMMNCTGVDLADDHASLTPDSSSLRAGLITKMCLSATAIDAAVQYATTGAGGLTTRWPNAADITGAYQRFYPGRTPSAQVHAALTSVVSTAQTNFSTTPLKGWRYLFLTICNSPEWQQP